ncbi:hypothetical protein EZY14_018190 [Kordia sp. TARA_039_SRF]|nr:hypothetical protein EZY14_018190 [Kordia sp. TARA_039_SRF]
MKKQRLTKLALGKKTISKFAAVDSIKGGITPTTPIPSFFCQPEPSGGGSRDILCPSDPLPTKGCQTNEPSSLCPI